MTEPTHNGQPDDLDLEAPEDDAREQRVPSYDEEDEETPTGETPMEADPADAAEQHRAAGTDDDGYDR